MGTHEFIQVLNRRAHMWLIGTFIARWEKRDDVKQLKRRFKPVH